MTKRNKNAMLAVNLEPENEGEKATRKFFGTFVSDIKRNWRDVKSYTSNHISRLMPKGLREKNKLNEKENQMSVNLLLIYEIADKAKRVKTKKAFKEFEKWLKSILTTYHDAAIERVAHIHLFQLRQQFSF